MSEGPFEKIKLVGEASSSLFLCTESCVGGAFGDIQVWVFVRIIGGLFWIVDEDVWVAVLGGRGGYLLLVVLVVVLLVVLVLMVLKRSIKNHVDPTNPR